MLLLWEEREETGSISGSLCESPSEKRLLTAAWAGGSSGHL